MPSERFTLPSFAKINWRLNVLGKREDGYHDLCTVFQTVSLADSIRFESAAEISLECDDPRIPTGPSNLILRAAYALREKYGVRSGAKIFLEKRIPAPGGLGGGSSNAATALIGLASLWSIDAGDEALAAIGSGIGSDVPFFLTGGTAFGTGRGTEIEPMPDIVEGLMLIVTPRIDVSTAEAFRGLNANRLTKESSERILKICRKDAFERLTGRTALTNDFEASVFAVHSEIRRVKEALLGHGAVSALMAGSGASVFAVFDKEETRQTTLKALGADSDWRMFAVSTVSRADFREALGRA